MRANASPIVRQLGGESSGAAFRRKRLYAVMVRFVVPVMMLILFLQSTGIMASSDIYKYPQFAKQMEDTNLYL